MACVYPDESAATIAASSLMFCRPDLASHAAPHAEQRMMGTWLVMEAVERVTGWRIEGRDLAPLHHSLQKRLILYVTEHGPVQAAGVVAAVLPDCSPAQERMIRVMLRASATQGRISRSGRGWYAAA